VNASEYLSKHWGPKRVWTHLEWPKHRQRLRLCAELCVGKTAVDVGCGYGHSTMIMAEYRPDLCWSGIEFDKRGKDLAREFFPNGDWLCGTVRELALAALVQPGGKGWDSAVCSEVIEHVESPSELLEGLKAIARERVIITTPNRAVNDPGHLRVYTRETLEAAIKEHFRICSIVEDGPFLFAVAAA
jgi:2-polyprenyl-3-methyl-5-hydroxy-6-metoxy-1,4-benzoquinol methylase